MPRRAPAVLAGALFFSLFTQRFYKVDKSRGLDAKGAGLGLYIVKMMVEMHSGTIWAQSESENTAEFVFKLPKQYSPIYKKGDKQ